MWTSAVILLFLAPYRKKYDTKDFTLNAPLSILFFILGLAAGWCNENSGAAVLALLAAYFIMQRILKNKTALFEVLGAAGFLAGFILLIMAPGYAAQMKTHSVTGLGHSDESLIPMLYRRFLDYTWVFIRNHGLLVMALSILLGLYLVCFRNRKIHLFSYFYALAAFASVYSMIFAPYFPDRTFLIVTVLSGITLGGVLTRFEWKPPETLRPYGVPVLCLLLVPMSFSVYRAGKNIISIYVRWQKRIEYITSEKERGVLDVAVKAPIPAYDKHAACYRLEDVLPDVNGRFNPAIAAYFGLRTIREDEGNTDPW
jgi:hypothetical protein